MHLRSDASIHSFRKISSTEGRLDFRLVDGSAFGKTVTSLGRLDPNAGVTLAVGGN